MNIFSNKRLSQQLESTEARMNMEFILSRKKMFPESKAEWLNINGTYAMFDGEDSPLTQTFGLGLFNAITSSELEVIEKFYKRFSAPVYHEVSPMADSEHLGILSKHGYQPVEHTNILYKLLSRQTSPQNTINSKISTRKLLAGEEEVWSSLNTDGWSSEIPGLAELMKPLSQIFCHGNGMSPFFANINDTPISTGILYIHDHVALLAGDSTIQEGRNQGGQNALIDARLNYAAAQGASLAMLAASPGSQSQKNAEKNGFQVAYTRTKWKLC
ncbi:MAG TPA: hypothetical protein VGP47_00045 [Parachlamydiaceae bacterium]|nr:hypothetical protein [Parachlamydiaceae bacterium]